MCAVSTGEKEQRREGERREEGREGGRKEGGREGGSLFIGKHMIVTSKVSPPSYTIGQFSCVYPSLCAHTKYPFYVFHHPV